MVQILGWLALAWLLYRLWRGFSGTRDAEPPPMGRSGRHGPGGVKDDRLMPADLADLLLLRHALREGHESGRLETARWEDLDQRIEALLAASLEAPVRNRLARLERAWGVLSWYTETPLGPPPWHSPAPETPAAEPEIPSVEIPAPAPVAGKAAPAEIVTRAQTPAQPAPPDHKPPRSALHEVLRPAEPGPLELALKAAGQRWAVLSPFLAQNIGWFLGGFCFIAGSMFLVAYTAGFGKALAVWGSLTLYVFLLLGGGFYLRTQRPELRAAGLVLLCLSAALIPLALAAAVRLWLTADSLGAGLLAVLAAGVNLVGFGLALPLVAGGVDRRLSRSQARFFLGLAAWQGLAVLLAAWPRWELLATAHGGLLVLCAAGFRGLLRDWLPAAPEDRTRLAAYAGGSLLYAVGVSYAHLSLSLPGPLPAGYHGPFLMALCALGFHGEARVRARDFGGPWLSRLGFLWYGLSGAALALAFPGSGPRILALALGAAMYTGAVWRYLSWVPLYALAFCLAWLYAEMVLFRLPAAAWLWAAAPLWYGLARINAFALRRRSEALGAIARRLLAGLTAVVAGCGLAAVGFGWSGCAMALLAAGLAELHRRSVPPGNPRESLLGAYAVPALLVLALAYAPVLPGLERLGQWVLALGLFQLAGLEWGLRRPGARFERPTPEQPPVIPVNPLLDWVLALAPLTLALAVVAPAPWIGVAGPVLTALMLLRLGLGLRCAWALYLALLLLGMGAALVKFTYLSGSSGGLVPFLAALAAYGFLRREENRPRAALQRAALRAGRFLPLRLWHRLPLTLPEDAERVSVWTGPLRAAFLVLWFLGLVLLARTGAAGLSKGGWVASALAGMAVSRLGVARFGLPFLMILVHGLGFAAAAVLLADRGLGLPAGSLLAALYGLALVIPRDLLADRAPWLRRIAPWTPEIAQWNAGWGSCLALAGMAAAVAAAWERATPGSLPGYFAGAAALLIVAGPGREWLRTPATGLFAGSAVLVHAVLAGQGLRAQPEDPVLPLLLAGLGLAAAGLAHLGPWLRSRSGLASRFFSPAGETWLKGLVRETALWWGAGAAVLAVFQVGPGPHARPGPLHIAALGLAASTLGWAGRHRVRGITAAGWASGMVALLWLEAWLGKVDFGYWAPLAGDRWLLLAAVSLGLGVAGTRRAEIRPTPWPGVAGGAWLWAFANAAALAGLWRAGVAGNSALWLAPLALTLAAALVPPRIPWGIAAPVHGLAVALLLAAGGFGLLAYLPGAAVELSFSGAFLLLILAGRPISVWNARFPRWALAAGTWPWLGLILALAGLAGGGIGPVGLWLVAAYLVLWSRTSGGLVPLWGGSLLLLLGGLAASDGIIGRFFAEVPYPTGLALRAMVALVWLMLLTGLARAFGSHREDSESARFRKHLGLSLDFWAGLAFVFILAAYGAVVAPRLPAWTSGLEAVWLLPGALLAVALAGRCRGGGDRLSGLALPPALLLLWLNADLALPAPIHPATALLPLAALAAHAAGRGESSGRLVLRLPFWRAAAPILVVAALAWLPGATRLDFGLCLAGLGLIAVRVGRQTRNRHWLRAGGAAFLALLHAWPWWAFGPWAVPAWAALQLALWAELAASLGLRRWLPPQDAGAEAGRRAGARFALGLAGLEWGLAVAAAVAGYALWPALAAGLGLVIPGGYREYRRPAAFSSRINLLLMVGILLLARLLWLGQEIPGVADAFALIVLGYAALGLFERFRMESLLALARLLPALAWLPVANRPEVASPILAAAGTLYLLAGRGDRRGFWPGILALNLAVYLWVPALGRSSGLIQVYALPAALTALILVHLHRYELRPEVRHGVRLAALATLYASAGVDLFLRPEIRVFVWALLLSLAGVGVGIAFRIRAFLYGGTAFLVLTVLGQMWRLYPEDRLARALVLMILGSGITVAMIGFQIKREAWLRRIRIVRADLGRWE